MHWLLQVVLLVTSVRSISFVGAQTCNAEAVDTCGRQRRRLPATGNGTESVPQTRIVNGAEVCPNFPYPHVVSLLMPSEVSGNSYIPTDDTQSFTVCGGTLVNRTHVITAAHCVDYNEYNLAGLAVDVHRFDLTVALCEECAVRAKVRSVTMHPDWDPDSFENDVAILYLEEPIPSWYSVPQIEIDDGTWTDVDMQLIIAGWGALNDPGGNMAATYPATLQAAEVEVVETNRRSTNCQTSLGVSSTMFCAAGLSDGGQRIDSCGGDSGGPIFVQCSDTRVILGGIVSWGVGCAQANYPGVYTRLSSFREWVQAALDKIEGEYQITRGVPKSQAGLEHGTKDCCCSLRNAEPDGCRGVNCTEVACDIPHCVDCDGNDCSVYASSFLGDGLCDNGEWGMFFNCEEWNWDEGDCDPNATFSSAAVHECCPVLALTSALAVILSWL